ncbi:unnamed protein product [Cladocopium goreaui]|uniref:Ubiquitin-like modifier-activating enzyme 5 n=1 Tax=Cladocopium goreaui TaxID=2562237 RepID=A0A9P1CAZ7_9DINO|nr:unnamed protein product [Cladocopium goreaui]
MALTELTSSHFRGFLRRDEEWPEDSEPWTPWTYKAGCDIENRKRPPPEEIPGDVFDRQRVIPDFDQGLIERQVCLVLGAGGIGQNVALTLARLGVQKIILVDNDIYVASNLTRQCLGNKGDVGKRKVDVAKAGLEASHNLRSAVVAVHCDAVLEWDRVVDLARQSTVVFNAIDVGVMWDFCVNSLCKELEIPLCAGQSFGWKFMTELYTGKVDEVCAFCYDSVSSTFGTNEKAITRQGGILERLGPSSLNKEVVRDFLKNDRQFRCHDGPVLAEVVDLALQSVGGQLRPESAEVLKFLQALQQETVKKLLPGKVSTMKTVGFIPQPKHAETRFVGSWVCPCLSCAVTMVSQWTGLLTAPAVEEGAPEAVMPQNITFNLDTGMTGEEQLSNLVVEDGGYELGSLGIPLDRAERRFCRDAARDSCGVCAAAAANRAEARLFAGAARTVKLATNAGEVQRLPAAWSMGDASSSLARGKAPNSEALVVPAMPARDWLPGGGDAGASAWPAELGTLPLLKVPESSTLAKSPSALWGYASGIRSALVPLRAKWYRLKGCGNRTEGFPVEKVGNKGEWSLRGSCFQHTAWTELRMTQLVSRVLETAGFDCANRPLGLYLYQPDPESGAWPHPEVERCCVVFETLGNARLGDHLIGGILALLPHLFEPDLAELKRCILRGRDFDPSDPELLETADVVSCGMATADVLAQLGSAGAAPARQLPKAEELENVPIFLRHLWDHLRVKKVDMSLLLWLAWRLGWECGLTLRTLHEAQISWGTYSDSMGIHCNAHINNFVVKAMDAGNDTFLAALDFDMAFTRENVLPEALQANSLLSDFDAILNFEATMGMKMVLAGSDFASTGVANAKTSESHRVLEVALRDTMVTAYAAALEGQSDAHPPQAELREASYDIIKLALCLTTHVEG